MSRKLYTLYCMIYSNDLKMIVSDIKLKILK